MVASCTSRADSMAHGLCTASNQQDLCMALLKTSVPMIWEPSCQDVCVWEERCHKLTLKLTDQHCNRAHPLLAFCLPCRPHKPICVTVMKPQRSYASWRPRNPALHLLRVIAGRLGHPGAAMSDFRRQADGGRHPDGEAGGRRRAGRRVPRAPTPGVGPAAGPARPRGRRRSADAQPQLTCVYPVL